METETVIDSRGRPCPLPVIDLAKAVELLAVGTEAVLLADDPGADTDVPAWCRMRGQELVEVTRADGHTRYRVRRIR
ncbi:sulfurtransferase TusA family protein [Euzebya sp.]|uniref:sulfurtransferase TusA family protein n=1 Tax=Euzebya sp. TaxID=1971409 RepID=UPI003516273B